MTSSLGKVVKAEVLACEPAYGDPADTRCCVYWRLHLEHPDHKPWTVDYSELDGTTRTHKPKDCKRRAT